MFVFVLTNPTFHQISVLVTSPFYQVWDINGYKVSQDVLVFLNCQGSLQTFHQIVVSASINPRKSIPNPLKPGHTSMK